MPRALRLGKPIAQKFLSKVYDFPFPVFLWTARCQPQRSVQLIVAIEVTRLLICRAGQILPIFHGRNSCYVMRRRLVLLIVLVAISSGGLWLLRPSQFDDWPGRKQNVLPRDTRRVLDKGETFILHSLEPYDREKSSVGFRDQCRAIARKKSYARKEVSQLHNPRIG